MKLEYIVKENDNYNYSSISDVLKKHFKISSRIYQKLIKQNSIYINNIPYDFKSNNYSDLLNIDDIVTIDFNYEEDNSNIVPFKMDLDIMYEDDWLLVINKPSGISIHPSSSHYSNSLSNGVRCYFDTILLKKKIRPVNRLDKDTSGLVIFAKCEYIHSILMKQMQNKLFKKRYFAIVNGLFEKQSDVIDLPIARKENSIIERCVSFKGQNAITKYKVLNENHKLNISLIDCELITGRTHQIRVHMSYLGHFLIGDTLYGESNNLISRQALHSYYLKFIHPITNSVLKITTDLPEDMEFIIKY